MEKGLEVLFKSQLEQHQKKINTIIVATCIISSIVGTGTFVLLKLTGIWSLLSWEGLIKASATQAIGVVLIGLFGLLFKIKGHSKRLDTLFMYVLITCGTLNYLSMTMFIPYNDLWGVAFLIFVLSSLYYDIKVMIYGLVINTGIGMMGFYVNSALIESGNSVGDMVARMQAFLFGGVFAVIGSLMARKFLYNSCVSDYKSINAYEHMKKVVSKASEISQQLKESSSLISHLSVLQQEASETTAVNVNDILSGTHEISESINESVKHLDLLLSGNVSMKNNITSCIDSSIKLQEIANMGKDSINDAVNKIQGIMESAMQTFDSAKDLDIKAKKIDNTLDCIREIAAQTSLLSLNASIEAARAGEYGRGFSVVANEIKILSERSGQSLNNIADVLKDMLQHGNVVDDLVKKVDEGIQIIKLSESYYQKIIEMLVETVDSLSKTGVLSNEQLSSTEKINQFMQVVKDVVLNTSQNVEHASSCSEETFASSEELMDSSKTLQLMSESLYELISKDYGSEDDMESEETADEAKD